MFLRIYYLLLLLLLLISAFVGHSFPRDRHSITFPFASPSSLLYDPSSQHFLVGSLSSPPAVTSVSDAGILETLLHDNLLPRTSSLPFISLDHSSHRLLASVTDPPSLAAYDLRSRRPHQRLFLTSLPFSPSAVAVDPSSGTAYVASASSGVIWKIDVDGKASAFSRFEVDGDNNGIDGMAFVGKGYLLAVQKSTGKVFKIDADNGWARVVSMRRKIEGAASVAMKSDGSAVVVGEGGHARILRSEDGYETAGVYDEITVTGREGKATRGVAVREGRRIYVLYGEGEGKWRVEEVESEREAGGEWIQGMVMAGIGLAVFLYWRFQMRQLVSNMNKKTA